MSRLGGYPMKGLALSRKYLRKTSRKPFDQQYWIAYDTERELAVKSLVLWADAGNATRCTTGGMSPVSCFVALASSSSSKLGIPSHDGHPTTKPTGGRLVPRG